MKTLLIQIIVLLSIVFMVYIIMKVSGFVGGKDEREKKEFLLLLNNIMKRKREKSENKTIQMNDWTIVELDEVGYPMNHRAEICFKEGRFSIGREKGNDFVLDNMTVSRKHAVIIDTPKGLILKKEKTSANGVKHNGKSVEEIKLVDGMILQLGKVFCKISLNDISGNTFFEDGIDIKNGWNNDAGSSEKPDYFQRKL